VRFGLGTLGTDQVWPRLRACVDLAESLGYDSFWVADHPVRKVECFTTLAALAAVTTRIRLGVGACCIYHRSPLMLARQAADVDVVSGGRLILGLGIGYDAGELAQLGVTMPTVGQRQAALAETVRILDGLWSGEPFVFEGRHFRTHVDRFPTPPLQRPRPPLLIAGGGERVTLRQVAEFGDASNFGPDLHAGGAYTLADVERKLAALRAHCRTFGRPFAAVERTYGAPVVVAESESAVETKLAAVPSDSVERLFLRYSAFVGTVDAAVAHYQSLVDLGITYLLSVIRDGDLETVRLLAERVFPALRRPSE
jgi:alkanesulfonate monooxygenase SsuD/methylene tetrahydromethanopterin reductase-like flavin-dependent oxidoreductase (luciferase family)